MTAESDTDLLEFLDEHEQYEDDSSASSASWQILVVDDDLDIHHVTNLILDKQTVLGRPLHIVHAFTGEEARELLAASPDFPVILLDVVMETEDAGLVLASYIRDTQKNSRTHIILRSGHPVSISELEAERNYGCNHYEQKNSVTAQRLIMMVERGLKDYISKSKTGLA
ncbi:response regulator [Zhongshania arctica]|uniref:Response regulator n=1 Tax=Zhongshania arctica TaxID=3238302 RepID=A0ABV3TXP0_9GAMM